MNETPTIPMPDGRAPIEKLGYELAGKLYDGSALYMRGRSVLIISTSGDIIYETTSPF